MTTQFPEQTIELWLSMLESMVRGGLAPSAAAAKVEAASQLGHDFAAQVLSRYIKKAGLIKNLRYPPGAVSAEVQAADPWYTGPQEGDLCWSALKAHLLTSGMPAGAVDAIDKTSTRTLALMHAPGLPRFSGRGLVLGHVQSGKTANYTALIAKAADAGYRLFIVLSGIHNILRSQTQARLDRELVDLNPTLWAALTEVEHDFVLSKTVPAASLIAQAHAQRVLLVVKKNPTVLRRVTKWLAKAGESVLATCPVAIIDDEADQASINTAAGLEFRTRINDQITSLLRLLPKASYVGYTATPFANVLIDPKDPGDLYPRDFILDIPASSDYFGAERLFGRGPIADLDEGQEVDGLDAIRIVPDDEVARIRPPASQWPTFTPSMTPSLEDALDYFWLATAARYARDQRPSHSTMLVHTTLAIEGHRRIQILLERHRLDRQARLLAGDVDLMTRLRLLWDGEVGRVVPELPLPRVEFDGLLDLLPQVVRKSAVVIENSQSSWRLTYGGDPGVFIVIGGNTLSRGLTLEGLVVSYFIRAASAYDTLLQMGRWFGYRKGYEDLPRIWTTRELADQFRDLALVEREIRADIRRYETDGVTPLDVGVRIRTHPALSVTSALKMQRAVVAQMSFSGKVVQTINFLHKDRSAIDRMWSGAEQLLAGLDRRSEPVGPHLLLRGIAATDVLAFVEGYPFHPADWERFGKLLQKYVRSQLELGELHTWNVAVIGRDRPRRYRTVARTERALLERSRLERASSTTAYLGVITSDSDLSIDLHVPNGADEAQRQALRRTTGPLLLLYPIAKDSHPRVEGVRRPLEAEDDLLGAAFVFPEASNITPQEYLTVDLGDAPREEEDIPEDDGDRA